MGTNGTLLPSRPIHAGSENNPLPGAPVAGVPTGGMCLTAVPAPLLVARDFHPATLDAFANWRVGPPLGLPGLPVVDVAAEFLRSDKDLHFTGALATNAEEQENLTGLLWQTYNIEAITLMSVQQLDWEVAFYTRDTFNTAGDQDNWTWIDSQLFARADGRQIAGAGLFLYSGHGLRIPYRDQDATNELHIGLINRDAVAKIAGAPGLVIAQVALRPVS